MRKVFSDSALDAQFVRDGYVRVPVLSSAELDDLREGIAALRPADRFAPGPEGFYGATYHCSFLDRSKDYKRRASDLLTRIFAPHVERLLADFTLNACNFYVKPPGKGDFGLHQNWPVLPDLNDVSVTLWCPLVDVTRENGAIGVVPRSHKIVPHVQGPDSSACFLDIEDQIIAAGLVETLDLKAGEAVIFDDSLIHGSPPNLTSEARFAVQLVCVPSDANQVFYRREGDDLFELIEIDADFWITHDVEELLQRPAHWRSQGYVRSRNRSVTLAELNALIDRGEETRRSGIGLDQAPGPPPPHSYDGLLRLANRIVRKLRMQAGRVTRLSN